MVYPGGEEYEAWLALNPLKKFMDENELTMIGVASALTRTPTMIYQWLRGVSLPANSWDRLEELTENPNIKNEWGEWMKNK